MREDRDWFDMIVSGDVPLWKKALLALGIGVIFVVLIVACVVGVYAVWSPLTG